MHASGKIRKRHATHMDIPPSLTENDINKTNGILVTSHTLTSQSNKVGKINLLNQKPSTVLEAQSIFKCQSHTNMDIAGVEGHFMFKAKNTVREPVRYEGESKLGMRERDKDAVAWSAESSDFTGNSTF